MNASIPLFEWESASFVTTAQMSNDTVDTTESATTKKVSSLRLDPYWYEDDPEEQNDLQALSVCTSALLAVVGLSMIKVAKTQRKNAVVVAIRVITQLCVIPFTFYIIGFSLANGESQGGFIGFDGIGIKNDKIVFGAIQCVVILYCRTIISLAEVESNYIMVDFIGSFLLGLLLIPFPVFWCWNSYGWLETNGYSDYGTVIFIVALGSGLCHLLLGQKMSKLKVKSFSSIIGEREEKRALDSGHNAALSGVGCALHIFGAIACLLLTSVFHGTEISQKFLPSILLNAGVSISIGGLTVTFVSRILTGTWSLYKTHGGMVAGLGAISCGAPLLLPWHAAALGVSSGLCYLAVRNFIQKLGMEDQMGVISGFGAPAVLSIVICPIIVHHKNDEWPMRFLWSICGASLTFLWSFGLTSLVFIPLNSFKCYKQRSILQKTKGGLDQVVMREGMPPICDGTLHNDKMEDLKATARSEELRMLASPRMVRPEPEVVIQEVPKVTMSPSTRSPAISNPKFISTTSNIPTFVLKPRSGTISGSTEHYIRKNPQRAPPLWTRSNSLASFEQRKLSSERHNVLSSSALPPPPLELLEEESPQRRITLTRDSESEEENNNNMPSFQIDHAKTAPVGSITNLAIHNQLKSLRPPKDEAQRRPSLSIRRELTPIRNSMV